MSKAAKSADLGALDTEAVRPEFAELDILDVPDLVALMATESTRASRAVMAAVPEIAEVVTAVARRLAEGGRLIYVGAGTAGRLGVLDAAEAGRAAGLKNVVISGGYIQREPLLELCKRVDAIKIDLKAYSEKFYKEVVNGELKPVLDTIATIRKQGVWNEIVYLVIPTLNDSDEQFKGLARWIKTELGPDVPLHFTRFHPEYLLKNLPDTPVPTLERAKAIADAEGLNYVYIGNVPGHPAESTYCPKCRRVVVERMGFSISAFHLDRGKCQFCQTPIPGVWEGALHA